MCFLPLYFVYGGIVPREFGPIETAASSILMLIVCVVRPGYGAVKKKFWMSAGLAVYGIVAAIPVWVLPGMADKLAGEDASIVTVIWAFLLRSIYGMAEAPFAPISRALGDSFAEVLPRRIMPVALILYAGVQLFRFYRDAYKAEQLDPMKAIDKTSIENGPRNVRTASIPEVLGTVISAPDASLRNNPEEVKKPTVSDTNADRPEE